MKTIAYYISDYGYGHSSRSIAIMRKLLNIADVNIIVCNSFGLSFIKESITSNRVSYREIKTDIGYVLEKDTINPDKARLLDEYKKFVSEWDHFIEQEYIFLRENKVGIVLSDISPLPFDAAKKLGILSIGISNFTWFTAYQDLIDEYELSHFKDAYKKMDYYFSLAGNQDDWNVTTSSYGFFSREIETNEIENIRRIVNSKCNQKMVFLGFGMKVDLDVLEQLPIWDSPNCVFLVSSNVKVKRSNVFQIPSDYLESQNYIAAADLVITKAGWGMVGEALNAKVPLLILNRNSMKEDQNTINYLKQYNLCKTIEWEDFKTYSVDIEQFSEIKKSVDVYHSNNNNQSIRIAEDILKIMDV